MDVSLIGPGLSPENPASSHLVHLARILERRGARVRLYVAGGSMDLPEDVAPLVTLREQGVAEVPDFAESDVCVYHVPGAESWLPEIRWIRHAVVIVDCHAPIGGGVSRWLHYADLCLAATPEVYADLVDEHGCAPERVYTLSCEDGQYEEEVAQLVERAATGRQVGIPALRREREVGIPALQRERQVGIPALLRVTLEVVRDRADVAMRDYAVHSRLPIVGPLVAWLRRNLTSHLREPYFDPIVERQVAFNREVSTWMEQAVEQLEQFEERLARLEEAWGDERRPGRSSSGQDETSREAGV